MGILVSSKNQEKLFDNKEVINIGTNPNCDFVLNLGFDLLLTLHYNATAKSCTIMNNFATDKVLFKGQPIAQRIEIDKMCKLMIANTDEFLTIKVTENIQQTEPAKEKTAAVGVQNRPPAQPRTMEMIAKEDLNEADIKGLYGSNANASTKIKLDSRKAEIEQRRVSILKEVGFLIDDLKAKLKINELASKLANIGLFLVPFITVMLLSDYFKAIAVYETGMNQGVPPYMRGLLAAAALLLIISLALRQGTFLYVQNKIVQRVDKISKIAETALLSGSLISYIVLFVIITILYLKSGRPGEGLPLSGALIATFGSAISMINALFCGYIKHHTTELGMVLDRHESREDFKKVIQDYQQWILFYINNLSKTRIQYIKNTIFNLQIKSVGEVILGILTAPFLAYGVSNTLAMCFPEAAGWIRISGLRFSPIFLTLATFLIIFAFFSLVSAFVCSKRVHGSEVIVKDGFNNFQYHGVDIYGNEGIKKLKQDRNKYMTIALAIIFIEFSMNISYFITEIGGEWEGLFLSSVAALVPTALLIAESYMLSKTQFEIYIHEQIISKFDKDF